MDIQELKNWTQNPLDPASQSIIQTEFEDKISFGEMYECKLLADYIAEILRAYVSQFQTDPELFDKYQTYWHRLAFKAFPSLSEADQAELMQHRLVFSINRGFDPDQLVYQYFNIYPDRDIIKPIFNQFLKSLQENSETIGDMPIQIDSKKYLPQFKYWLTDYLQYPAMAAKRGSIDRLNYVNQSQNARALTQAQRQSLLKALKLFDDFSNPDSPLIEKSAGPNIKIQVTEPQAKPQPSFAVRQPAQPAIVQQVRPPSNQTRPAAVPDVRVRQQAVAVSDPPILTQTHVIDIDSKLEELRKRSLQ